jgi:hypothetical protein
MEMYANPARPFISILVNVCADVSHSHLEIFGMVLKRKLGLAKSMSVSQEWLS